MFFHIFRNTFITNSNIPSEIRINNQISKDLYEEDKIDTIFEYLINNHNEKNIIFYELNDRMLNPIIQHFCLHLGLDYESYEIMVEHFEFYKNAIVKVYEPNFIDNYKPIPKRMWCIDYQDIFWNSGLLPFEYWINHVFYDEYATNLYTKLLINYKNENNLISKLSRSNISENTNNIPLNIFIDSPYNNMVFNDEFIIFYFNKKLMYHLRDMKFNIRFIESGIDKDLVSLYNKESGKVVPNYDNESIYKILFD